MLLLLGWLAHCHAPDTAAGSQVPYTINHGAGMLRNTCCNSLARCQRHRDISCPSSAAWLLVNTQSCESVWFLSPANTASSPPFVSSSPFPPQLAPGSDASPVDVPLLLEGQTPRRSCSSARMFLGGVLSPAAEGCFVMDRSVVTELPLALSKL